MPMLQGAPQTTSPDMLQALLTDPRATPQQRAAAVAQLTAMGGKGQPPQGSGGLAPVADASGGDDEGPTDWLSSGASAATGKGDTTPDMAGGTGDLAGWHGDFMKMIKQQMAGEGSGNGELTSEDKALALAKAGFGMAASGSPNFGTALGQGAVYGIDGLEQLKRQRAQDRLRRDSLLQQGLLRQQGLDISAQAAKDRAAAADSAHQDRQDSIAERAQAAKDSADARRIAAETAAGSARDRADALAEQRYTSADARRRASYTSTGQWQSIAGDDDHGVTGAPESTEYEGPLITSPKISPKQKMALEVARPKTEQAATLVVDQLGDMGKKAQDLLSHPGLNKGTGFTGTLMSKVPGTDAANFLAEVDSLKSGTLVTNLNAMRQASTTGGALGSVTEREGDRMASLQASLAQAQTPEAFKQALQTIVDYSHRTGGTIKKAYVETYGDKGAPELPWEKTNPDGAKGDGDKKPSDTVTYDSPEAVGKAVRDKTITAADGHKILRDQFGFEE